MKEISRFRICRSGSMTAHVILLLSGGFDGLRQCLLESQFTFCRRPFSQHAGQSLLLVREGSRRSQPRESSPHISFKHARVDIALSRNSYSVTQSLSDLLHRGNYVFPSLFLGIEGLTFREEVDGV